MVPKIDAFTISEQRQSRQRQIIDAAMELAVEGGASAITVSTVAKRAGIPRSSIYEYFSSSADLVSDLIMEELENYGSRLSTAVKSSDDPYEYIENWIAESLKYIEDGRHMIAKSLNAITVPEYRRAEISAAHGRLMQSIAGPLQEIGIVDVRGALSYLQNTLDTAATRIDSGKEPSAEVKLAQRYAMAGIKALTSMP